MNRARLLYAVAMLAILALAAAFRLPQLAQRPMHADEANQAVKASRLYATGKYEYDTTDHHGPSLYWLTLPSLWMSGAKDLASSSETAYRVVPVIFGLGLIALVGLFGNGLGRAAVVAAALLTAISPAMVYFSRYYIQEMLLVFFTVAAIGCGWQYARCRHLGWMLAAGAAVGMMHATKETWILSAAAAAGAGGLTWGWTRFRDGSEQHQLAIDWRLACHLLAGVCMAVRRRGVLFDVRPALAASLGLDHRLCQLLPSRQPAGRPHEPWYYYLQLLFADHPSKKIFWSEGFIALLAIVGAVFSLAYRGKGEETSPPTRPDSPSPALLRFLTFYTILLTVLYCLVPYKTPWCALSFLMGMILLAGVGVAAIFRILPARSVWIIPVLLMLIAGAGHLGWQAYQLNFKPRLMADPLNPYVYAHTPMPLPRLGLRLECLAQRVPEGNHLSIQVVADNYWPLPWYLRKFDEQRVGYWRDANSWKEDRTRYPPPAILMISADIDEKELGTTLDGYNGPSYESLRPGVLIAVYVGKDLWPAYLECRVE